MRTCTFRYHQARRAAARPVLYLELSTDLGLSVLGKDTPSDAYAHQVGAFWWSSGVLSFGEFQQALSDDSGSVSVSLSEKVMDSYTVTLDNAHREFTTRVNREQILNAELRVKQGFEFPDFTAADFLTLFSGRVSSLEYDSLVARLTADVVMAGVEPDDPVVEITQTYAMRTTALDDIGAQAVFLPAVSQETFMQSETWTETITVILDDPDQDQVLYELLNGAYDQSRWSVSLDADGHVKFSYTTDVNTPSPAYMSITTDYAVPPGLTSVTVNVNAIANTVTISTSIGQSYTETLPAGSFAHLATAGGPGTGDGQFQRPRYAARDADDNVYVTDQTRGLLQKFAHDGTYLSTITSLTLPTHGVAIAPDGTIYVSDFLSGVGNGYRIHAFDSNHTFLFTFPGTNIVGPGGLWVANNGDILGTKPGVSPTFESAAVVRFSAEDGTLLSTFSTGGEFLASGIIQDSDGYIYVCDQAGPSGHRVRKFTNAGGLVAVVGGYGSGPYEFDVPAGLAINAAGNLLVADSGNQRIQEFTTGFALVSSFSVPWGGSGYFTTAWGLSVASTGDLAIVDSSAADPGTPTLYARVQIFGVAPALPDFSDTGDNDTLLVARNVPGATVAFQHGDYIVTGNDDSLGDFLLIDGEMELYGTLESVTTVETLVEVLTPYDDVILLTAGRYPRVSDSQRQVILPLPYGDLRENSGSGVYVCPLIDTEARVYCVAGWPIVGNVVIFVDGFPVPASNYALNLAHNYQGQGQIATATFWFDLGESVVTATCCGRPDGDGVLITNPIDMLADWLDYAVGLTNAVGWRCDEAGFARARAVCVESGYTAAGVIQANNALGHWVKTMLASFLGSFRFDAAGVLGVFVTPSQPDRAVFDWLETSERMALSVSRDLANVFNQVRINYAIAYANVDRRFKSGGEGNYYRTADNTAAASIRKYGIRLFEMNADWTRNRPTVEAVQAILLDRYAEPAGMVMYEGQDFSFLPLELGDHIQGPVALLPAAGDAVFELRAKSHNLDAFTTRMTLQLVE